MSKRTQFRNQHKLRQAPKATSEVLLAAQVSSGASPATRKDAWATALYGMAEWWKYIRLRNHLRRHNHKPHQGAQEMARRTRMGSAAYRGAS